jgi:hypothetical protein
VRAVASCVWAGNRQGQVTRANDESLKNTTLLLCPLPPSSCVKKFPHQCLSLEEKHARHVSRTTEVLSRLEGQMRQLMMQQQQQQQQQRAVSPASQPASVDRSLVDRLAPPPMQPAPPQQQPQPPPQPQQPAFEAAGMAWEEDGEVELPSYAAMRRSRAAGAGGAVMGSAAVPGAAAPPFANARMAPAPAAPAPRSNGSRVPAVFSSTAAAAAGANGWAEESDAGCF